MRDYTRIDSYLDKLLEDIYPQPQDPGHTALATEVINHWMSRFTNCRNVLDVGAGEGFCQYAFERLGTQYTGVALGEDVIHAQEQNKNVVRMDFSFLEYPDNSFDLVFGRHSLEHSPMPLLTLFEWTRVAKNWVGIVLPAPEHYTYKGLNHYSVMNMEQIQNLTQRAGLNPLWTEVKTQSLEVEANVHKDVPVEYWLMYEKRK
jgi:ubiquinone/menaquinone biosynthesis C-methylase UbiE